MPDRQQSEDQQQNAPFDEALTQLETVVRKLEGGDLKLEEALDAFEEGMRLSKLCETQLTQAETRVRELVPREDGELEERPAELPELEGAAQ